MKVKKLSVYRASEWPELASRIGYRSGDMAKLLNVSMRTLDRYMHAEFGMTTEKWLDVQRMSHAPHILKRLHSVKQTASTLGYNCTRTFSSRFLKQYRLYPAEYLAVSDREAALQGPNGIIRRL